MHIISLIVCYLVIALAYIMLIKLHKRHRRIAECKRNHPAGRQSKTELSPTGQMSETFFQYPDGRIHEPVNILITPRGTGKKEWERAHHLQGD